MRTGLKRILSAFLVVLMLLPSVLSLTVFAEDATQTTQTTQTATGATFAKNVTYTTSLVLSKAPAAFEATIKLPAGYTSRAGVIFGNYSQNGTSGISFELASKDSTCRPRLYYTAPNVTHDCTFDTAIPTGEDVHIAITITDNKATLYINGVEKETKSLASACSTVLPANKYMVGGDLRGGNEQYFKGEIKNVAVYSEPLTAAEIAQAGVDYTQDKLMCAYDLTQGTIEERIKDLSKNGIDLIYSDPTYDKTELSKGLTFTSSDTYKMCKLIKSAPVTFEVELFLPTGVTDRGGVILGNYSQREKTVNLEIYTGGQPRLYFEYDNGTLYDFTFNQVDIRGSWVNLAIVLDAPNGLVHCYVNGRLRQTINNGAPIEIDDYTVYGKPLYLGRDTRGGDGRPFLGALKSLALYDDIRVVNETINEIAADCERVDVTDANLVAAYYFTEESGRNDITANAHNIYYNGEEITNPDEGEGGGSTNPDPGETPDDGEEGGNTDAGATTLDGMTFEANKYAIIDGSFGNNSILTVEATILIPETFTERVGVIAGNYNDNNNYFSFEVLANGVPRFCFPSESNGVVDVKFEKLAVNTGRVVHLAITYDPTTGLATCYINGEHGQTRTLAKYTYNKTANDTLLVLGNDLRKGSAQTFKGTIGSLAIFSDVRDEHEIKADYQGINLNSDNLMVYYDLTGKRFGNEVENLAGDKFDIAYKSKAYADTKTWFEGEEPTDYLYSFAIVGDTQIIAQNHQDKFHMIYDWILNNKTSKNIQYVFGLGDITNNSSSGEWSVAEQNLFRLNGVIPHSAVRGNHDKIAAYNNLFANNEAYMSQFDGFYAENDATNTYRLITIGGVKYLMITLDYGASDDVLAWAGGIIEKHSDYKVIITTHAYLYRDGTTLGQNDVCPPATTGGYNNGDHIWDKLASQYENVFMVISGHDPCADVIVTQTTGKHGNLVTQMLVDFQGVDTSVATGMVTMLYFKADGSVEVETYSTIQEKHYKETNQFTIEEMVHDYSINKSFVYENGYNQAGKLTIECSICNEEHIFETKALIEFLGYSVSPKSNGICSGYHINNELVSKYEELNETQIQMGAVISPYQGLANAGKPINGDGTKAPISNGKIYNCEIENEFVQIDVILRANDWSAYLNYEVILCMYIIENGSVYYICSENPATQEATPTTYASIIS